MKAIVIGLTIVMSLFIASIARADCPYAVGSWAGPLKCACDCSCPLPSIIDTYVNVTNQNGCFFKGYVWLGGEGRSLTGRMNSATHEVDMAVGFAGLNGTLVMTPTGYAINVVAPVVDYQNIQCTCKGTFQKQ